MRRLLTLVFLVAVRLLLSIPTYAQVVQSCFDGELSGSPHCTPSSPVTVGHVLLAFGHADNNIPVPSNTTGISWISLYSENVSVAGYSVYYAVANSTASTSISWTTTGFFTHSAGYFFEFPAATVPPVFTVGHGVGASASVLLAGLTWGITNFQAPPVTWTATQIKIALPIAYFITYLATPAGSDWDGADRVNSCGVTDLIIEAWTGTFKTAPMGCNYKAQSNRAVIY